MSNNPTRPDAATGCGEKQTGVSSAYENDFKPLLRTVAGLGIFFGTMAVASAFGGLLVILARNVAKLF